MTARRQILIIDDERDIVEAIQMALEANGYDVVSASDGEEALDKVRQHKPDLIILDVVMPKMNGYQVCRELKNDEATKTIPILMLTAKAQESDRFWGKETGADDYITKPFELSDLLARMKSFLEPI